MLSTVTRAVHNSLALICCFCHSRLVRESMWLMEMEHLTKSFNFLVIFGGRVKNRLRKRRLSFLSFAHPLSVLGTWTWSELMKLHRTFVPAEQSVELMRPSRSLCHFDDRLRRAENKRFFFTTNLSEIEIVGDKFNRVWNVFDVELEEFPSAWFSQRRHSCVRIAKMVVDWMVIWRTNGSRWVRFGGDEWRSD